MILLRQKAAAKEMASTSATSARMTCGRRFALPQVQPALSQIVSLAGGGGAKILRSGDGASRCRASSLCSTSVEAGRLPASATGLTSLLGIAQVANASLWNWDHWFYDSSSMNIVNGEGCIAPLHRIIFHVTDSVSGDQRSTIPDEGHQSEGARSRHGLLAEKIHAFGGLLLIKINVNTLYLEISKA